MLSPQIKHVLLAEDDEEDSGFFEEALNDISLEIKFTRVKDGIHLMELLHLEPLPDMIFLDINMPLKNGFQCLTEIRRTEKTKLVPVIIFSTSSDEEIINRMYHASANLYISKPNDFNLWKVAIEKVLSMDWERFETSKEGFALTEF